MLDERPDKYAVTRDLPFRVAGGYNAQPKDLQAVLRIELSSNCRNVA